MDSTREIWGVIKLYLEYGGLKFIYVLKFIEVYTKELSLLYNHLKSKIYENLKKANSLPLKVHLWVSIIQSI